MEQEIDEVLSEYYKSEEFKLKIINVINQINEALSLQMIDSNDCRASLGLDKRYYINVLHIEELTELAFNISKQYESKDITIMYKLNTKI